MTGMVINDPGAFDNETSRQAELYFYQNKGEGVIIKKFLSPWILAKMGEDKRKSEGSYLHSITKYLFSNCLYWKSTNVILMKSLFLIIESAMKAGCRKTHSSKKPIYISIIHSFYFNLSHIYAIIVI